MVQYFAYVLHTVSGSASLFVFHACVVNSLLEVVLVFLKRIFLVVLTFLGGLLFVPFLPFSLGTRQLMLLKMQGEAHNRLGSGGVYVGFVEFLYRLDLVR